jgi:phosphonate transport system substrate-binding protein
MRRFLTALFAAFAWLASATPACAADGDLNMVVTAAFVSERGMPVYRDIAKYVGKKLGRKAGVVSGISYADADSLLQRGVVQVGFVCGLPYTRAQARGKYVLVAMPVMALTRAEYPDAAAYPPGKYFSYTIVRKDSPINSWAQLRGKRYAYNEKISNSGYNMPRYKLVQLGAKSWEEYFSTVTVSGSHEESIRLVARGLVDASSVDSMVLDYDRHIRNPDALNVKVIERLFPGGAGIPPVVMTSNADPALRQALENILVNMHKDPEGKRILDTALLARFDPPDDANYDDIRHMDEAARRAGFRDYR